jgi:hypothetical protein
MGELLHWVKWIGREVNPSPPLPTAALQQTHKQQDDNVRQNSFYNGTATAYRL